MAGYSDKAATYASAEQMFLAHIQHCLAPRWTNYEQTFDAMLLTEKERDSGLFTNFTEEGMLRGSIVDTKDVLLGYTNGGLMTPNEARAKLDLNPDADPASDKLRIPANIVGTLPEAETPDKGATNGK
jgi:phage portal protein BeeE